MPVKVQYTLPAYQRGIFSTILRNKVLLSVKVDGIGYDIVYDAPEGRQVQHKRVVSGAGLLVIPEAVPNDRIVKVIIK